MKKVIQLFILLCSLHILAQKSYIQKHQKYFELPRESIFVHTNKSVFTNQEHLWYKGYLLDRTSGKLNDEVRNIQVFVYDSIGKLKDKSMVLSNEGLFFNQIKIDSTFKPGRYYFKAMTNYMNNFKASDVYFQQFEVIDEIKESQIEKKIEVSIRPEGQSLVYGLDSSLGVKITNKMGEPEPSLIYLLENGEPIIKTKSSSNGLGKINFKPLKSNSYEIKIITSNGSEKIIPIDEIDREGTTLHLNNLKNYVYLKIENSTLNEDDQWRLIIHQEQKISSINIEIDSKEKNIALEKEKLFDGLNTIQLLKNNNIISERLYFKPIMSDVTDLSVDYNIKKIKNEDSLILSLEFENKNKIFLSASILPKENISYQSNHSILKNFRLKPYINPNDFNSLFNFKQIPNAVELDILLLMTTTRYNNYIENFKPPQVQFEKQNGFNQQLMLINKIKNNDELLIGVESTFNKEFAIKLDTTQVFNFKNRYPIIGENLQFSIITKQRNFKAPKVTVSYDIYYKDLHPLPLKSFEQSLFLYNNNMSSNKIISNFANTNELDEVIIKGTNSKNNDLQNEIMGIKEEKISMKEVQQYFKLSAYLRYKGFNVTEQSGVFSVTTRNQRSLNSSNEVAIILDGTRLTNPSFLNNIQLSQFESIEINRTGLGEGVYGANGVIKLKTRKTPINSTSKNKLFTSLTLKNGFKKSIQYKNPNYLFYTSQAFKQLGAIAWFPNIIIQKGNPFVNLKIIDTKLKSAVIYIEGISENGELHSYKIPIELNKE